MKASEVMLVCSMTLFVGETRYALSEETCVSPRSGLKLMRSSVLELKLSRAHEL